MQPQVFYPGIDHGSSSMLGVALGLCMWPWWGNIYLDTLPQTLALLVFNDPIIQNPSAKVRKLRSSSLPSRCPAHLSHHVHTPKYPFLPHTEVILNPNRLRGKDSVLVPQDLSLEQLVVTPECFSFSFFMSFVLLCTMISASRHILLR